MSDSFIFHTYIYLIIKSVLRREPAKKEFDRAVKAILEYNPKAFTLFQEELFKLIEIDKREINKNENEAITENLVGTGN